MSIKAKQVAGVTTLVVVVVLGLSAYHLATLARLSLQETAARGQMLAQAIFQRALKVVAEGGADPYAALRADGGVRSMLGSSVGYSENVTYAAIVDKDGVAVAHVFPSLEGQPMAEQEDLVPLVHAGTIAQLRAVYSDRTFEIRQQLVIAAPAKEPRPSPSSPGTASSTAAAAAPPAGGPDTSTTGSPSSMPPGDQQFGDIRIGVSTLLVRNELRRALWSAAGTVLVALALSSLFAMLLSQWMLRPIHVIQSGLSRLGRGELDVRLDLPEQEFRDLGSSFDAVSQQLSAMGRGTAEPAAGQVRQPSTDLESVMDNLEDAVALFSTRGEVIFSNAAMNALHGGPINDLPEQHPLRQIVERTLAGRKSQGPVSLALRPKETPGGGEGEADAADRLVISHAITDAGGRFIGAMLVARNLAYLSQVHSTLNYSRKLAALGRLMAGVAHEVKNPLNAMTIHLELLKQKLARQQLVTAGGGAAAASGGSDVAKHVDVISKEIRRLDEVVNGFLKFARPDELKLQPVRLATLISDVATTASAEAERRGITVSVDCPGQLPEINADPGMLGQALLNLALNGCQAMADGGTLKIGCRAGGRHTVQVDVEDTGVGIPPEHLGRIFDLYFTTKDKGSGIGLSMVYRIVQLHDGEVEVQSTPGRGTRFRLIFPQA